MSLLDIDILLFLLVRNHTMSGSSPVVKSQKELENVSWI